MNVKNEPNCHSNHFHEERIKYVAILSLCLKLRSTLTAVRATNMMQEAHRFWSKILLVKKQDI